MGYVYTGRQIINNTFRLDGHSPLDSRTVLSSVSDVYINHENKDACELYLNAYAGMVISAFDDNHNVVLITLNDHTPYTKDNTSIDVTSENFETYWNIIGKFTEDKIQNVIDPSINKIEDYVGSNTNVTNNGGITVTPSKDASSVGYSYGLSVNVDDDTVKLVDDTLEVGQYKIERCDVPTDDFLVSYKLMYKAPGSSSWIDVTDGNMIDIPKDFVLKSVHICKAYYDDSTGTYVESSLPGDSGWDSDTNDVYFHFEWMTKDSDATVSNTFLRVADVIAADIVSINTSIGLLEDRDEELQHNIDSSYVEVIEKIVDLSNDVSANMFFDGGSTDDNFRMITKHGNLGIKTIGQLEQMTLSDIFKAILFEVAVPAKSRNESLTVSWVSSSPYKSTVDVGRPFPTTSEFNYIYTSEQWNWTASDGVTKGTPKTLSTDGGHTWKHSTTNNTSGTISTDWSDKKAVFGTNGYFFVTVSRTANEYAVDSQGNTQNEGGTVYKAPVSGDKNTTGTFLSFSASHRLYTNANTCSTTSNYDQKDTSPGAYEGDVQNRSQFLLSPTSTTTVYLQWPQFTDKTTQHCYLYVPKTHKINKCNGANPTKNAFDIAAFETAVVDSTVKINNGYADIDFNKYEITWAGDLGIVTLEVVIARQ